ncbi:Tyrosine-protein phosphatase precursor [Nocardioides dokdonensis FR1436]|uniref:Tyrosine-protein phosphatase n=1 Tax=Nocardioides dokdonensis FR1436 TaxID=1300347 RepID=A0A1A9GIX1_9ACTN|nr:tyrosine-protein phosphatase [Nocardioides dokdonensis]ANH38259.1 Tyrosine-protein phosphatase precursor [Nocardioides dokdonensis FR1436]
MSTPPVAPDLLNLRDVAGLRTTDGRTVRPGVLLRCATPAFVDDAQVERLVQDLGVQTRVDLRTQQEADEATSSAFDAVAVEHLEVHAGGRSWDFQSAHQADWVAGHYLRFTEHSPDALVAFARLVGDPARTAVLAHCTAGKDRTGTAVALTLAAVGVREDDLSADYARTEQAMPLLREQFRRLPSYQARLEELPAEAFGSPPEVMRRFLRLVEQTYGGARAYLRAHGLSDDELVTLEAQLLGPTPD